MVSCGRFERQVISNADPLAWQPLVGDDEFAERVAVKVDDLATGFAEAQADCPPVVIAFNASWRSW